MYLCTRFLLYQFLIDAVVASESETKLFVLFFVLIVCFFCRFSSICLVIVLVSKFAYRFLEKLFFRNLFSF